MVHEDDVKGKVMRQFGAAAAEYVTSESHAKGDDLSLMLDWLRPERDWIMLDVATGGGHVARTLAPHVDHVFATDLTPSMLSVARDHLHHAGIGNAHFVLADAEQLPFLDDTFDLVTCRIASHHFPHPERFLQESARVLKPGGSFLLIDNVAPDTHDLENYLNTFERIRDESHVRCLSVEEWSGGLLAAGLSVRQSRLRKKSFDFPNWANRMIKSQEQLDALQSFMLSGSEEALAYFRVEHEATAIRAFETDEWMVLASKG